MNSRPTPLKGGGTNTYSFLIALGIVGLWATSLILLLVQDWVKLSVWFIACAVLWQAFLYTGLFITAHDAMHGAVFPQNPKVNHRIGAIAVFCYGFFSYSKLIKKHWLHHHHPASDRDPDFHDGNHPHSVQWYVYFMKRYWGWQQAIWVGVVFTLAHYLLHVPIPNLLLFWFIPSILSSMQLFFFGTFLPHREPKAGYQHPHRAQTIAFPPWLSFLTCYHFGYHEEHHEYPQVPWWQLPEVHAFRSSHSSSIDWEPTS